MSDPNNTFVWCNFAEWQRPVGDWLKEAIPPAMQHETKAAIDSYLEEAPVPLRDHLSSRFKGAYSKIRLFHACRPRDVESYLTKDLDPLNTGGAEQEARTIFLSGDLPAVSEEMLNDALVKMRNEKREGRLYLVLDDIFLNREARHYLIYGSEYVVGVAGYLSRKTGTDCLRPLLGVGIPTMFVCDVPLCYLTESHIQALLRKLISCFPLRAEAGDPDEYRLDHAITFCRSLPPDVIVSHYHPQRIVNKIQGGTYVNSHTRCEFCA